MENIMKSVVSVAMLGALALLVGIPQSLSAENQSDSSCENIFEQKWVKKKVKEIMSEMTLDDKVNQMFFYNGPADPTLPGALGYALTNNIGGIFWSDGPPFGNDAAVFNTVAERRRQIDFTNSQVKNKIPLFYGSDNTHSVELNEIVNFPQPHSFQTISNDDIEEMGVKEGQMIASVSQKAGFNLTFAPTAIVAFNRRFGRVFESASDKGEKVARYCAGFVRGVQSIRTFGKGRRYISGICATTKHFIADGSGVLTNNGDGNSIENGNAIITTSGSGDYETFLKNTGAGFAAAIKEETGSVIVTFTSLQSNQLANTGQVPYVDPASLSQRNFETLKASGFFNHKGFVLSDFESPSLCLFAQDLFDFGNFFTNVSAATAYSISLGLDMFLGAFFNLKNITFLDQRREYIKAHVEEERINDAVSRILSVKVAMGLFDPELPRFKQCDYPEKPALDAYNNAFKSLVYTTPIVTNDGGLDAPGFVLPSTSIIDDPTRSKTVLLLGREAGFDPNLSIPPIGGVSWNAFYDDIGIQNGGWSTFSSFNGVTGSRTILGTDPISTHDGGVSTATSANVNDLYQGLRSTPLQLPSGAKGTVASTILDGFNNIGATTQVFDSTKPYDPATTVAVMVIGEFAYQEEDGEIDSFASCDVFDITRTDDTTYNPMQGVKLSALTYDNLKAAFKQGIQIVTVILGSRDQTSWNYTAPLYAADSDPFGQLSITDVSSAIVYSLLPGTSGGDAIVQFLYNTPIKLGKNQSWIFNRTDFVAFQPGTDPTTEFCGGPVIPGDKAAQQSKDSKRRKNQLAELEAKYQ